MSSRSEFQEICRDPECRAHGRYLRRLRRLQVALFHAREQTAEDALELKALRAEAAALRITHRQRLTRAWSAWLELAMEQELDDGTPVLAVVMAHNPDLRDRLDLAMRGMPHD